MYHRYKHQRATQHLVDLYEADRNNTDDKHAEQARSAIRQIESINSRIRELNKEFGLPVDLGVIDYGAFIYGWNQKGDRDVLKEQLERFCERKQYMRGWSRLPPVHDYEYPVPQDKQRHEPWDAVVHWLSLIWTLLRQHSKLEIIDELEEMLLRYIGNEQSSAMSMSSDCQFDVLGALVSLHEMSRLLDLTGIRACPSNTEWAYEHERQQLRCMCEFNGCPSEWIPAALAQRN